MSRCLQFFSSLVLAHRASVSSEQLIALGGMCPRSQVGQLWTTCDTLLMERANLPAVLLVKWLRSEIALANASSIGARHTDRAAMILKLIVDFSHVCRQVLVCVNV